VPFTLNGIGTIAWHRWNAIREIRREEEAETRQIRREQQEILRKHWQELQSNLISLNRIVSHLVQLWRFVEQNRNTEDVTTIHVMTLMSNRLPVVLTDFGDYWGRAVAQLNVFPQPRDALTLEVLILINELGDTVRDSSIEVRDETLQALAELARRVSERATLPRLDAQGSV
jgi:transcriptional regulator of heat shock response